MATKKSSGINKSQWVRDQPASTPASELVTAAKKAGITITPGFVYSIRSAAKTSKAGAPKKVASAAAGGGSLDAAIRAIVREEIKAFFNR